MADPLSLAASIIALTHAIRAGGKGLAKLKSSYSAAPEIARLKAELASLGQLLESVQTLMNGDSGPIIRHSHEILVAPVELATARINSINKILASPAFGLSGINDANQARLTLFRYGKRLATLEREVKASIQDIGVRLSFISARATTGLIGDQFNIQLNFQEAYTQKVITSLEQIAVSHFQPAASKASERNSDNMTPLKEGQRPHVDASCRNLIEGATQARALPEASSMMNETTLKKRFDCRPGCNCPCHIKGEFRSPWLMNFLLGELSVHWRSQKSVVQCNCSGHKGLAVIYRFPRYVARRYLSMILQTTYLDGPELILRVPRVLPWTHLLWRYSVCGDLIAIKRMYADRTASPYDVDPAGRNALLYASKQHSAKVAQFLLDQGTDGNQLDNIGRSPNEQLLKRSFGGLYGDHGQDIIRRVLNGNGNDCFDEFGFTTLHKIVLGFELKDLRTVLDATTDTINTGDSIGRTALFWAVIRDNLDHVRLLLSYGADPNAKDVRGFAPVDFVRGPEVCELLLSKGAKNNINPKNHDHSSIHEQAIENGCAEVISLFEKAGFDIDIKDHDNETPLLNAVYAGHTAMAKRLIELGANINNANISSRDSALHFAAAFDRPEILKLLLEQGADYSALDCNGRNLAHCAARAGSTELVKVMARANLKQLDLSLKDYEDKTPADYMSERIVLTDLEVGVHEAWEEFVTAFPRPVTYLSGDGSADELPINLLGLQAEDSKVGEFKVPGAFPSFPVVQVQEVGVDA